MYVFGKKFILKQDGNTHVWLHIGYVISVMKTLFSVKDLLWEGYFIVAWATEFEMEYYIRMFNF